MGWRCGFWTPQGAMHGRAVCGPVGVARSPVRTRRASPTPYT